MSLLYVAPGIPVDYVGHGRLSYRKEIGDSTLRGSLRCEGADHPDVTLGYKRTPVSCPAEDKIGPPARPAIVAGERIAKTECGRPGCVFASRDVFEITGAVIRFGAVLVVDDASAGANPKECLRDDPVNGDRDSVGPHRVVSAAIPAASKYPPREDRKSVV